MRITFMQIYAEPGASFRRLDGPFLGAMRAKLDALSLTIEKFASTLKEKDFELVFILSAESALSSVKVMGPNVRRKAREVEFSLFLPWRFTANFIDEVKYVLPHIGEGICHVLAQHGVEASGVAPCLEALFAEVQNNPKLFQYPNRPDDY